MRRLDTSLANVASPWEMALTNEELCEFGPRNQKSRKNNYTFIAKNIDVSVFFVDLPSAGVAGFLCRMIAGSTDVSTEPPGNHATFFM